MPAFISHIHQTRTQSAKLQAASTEGRYCNPTIASKRLKQRHDRLLKLQETTSIQGPLTTSTEEEEETATPQISIDQLEDGTFKLTLPPDEAHEQPRVLILTSPDFKKDEPTQNIIIMAEELIRTTMGDYRQQ
ncbi:hypothetical protein C0995_002519 [Termitomyces sp. Mi166|nr:hypothetical protein C0995_002519 [Termitomyces sp. Mi166\